MPATHDVIVLGHGLAGAAFVEACWSRGLRVAMVGAHRAGEASTVAAGLVNPLVLRRLVPSWRVQEILPFSREHYRRMEQREDMAFWHAMPLDVVFPDAAAARHWATRSTSEEAGAFMATDGPEVRFANAIRSEHGTGRILQSAWLDVNACLAAQRDRLVALGDFFAEQGVPRSPRDGSVEVGPFSAPLLVRCEGAFARLPGLVPVKGETLVAHIPGLGLGHMLHRGVFMQPLGGDRYRIGATFKWDGVWEGPTAEGRKGLLDRAAGLLAPEAMARLTVLEHASGVRPAAKDRRPILGRLNANEAVFNGLGARGVLLAPWCGEHLAAHLFDGRALDPEVDHRRFAGGAAIA